jgi:hypothetical protein
MQKYQKYLISDATINNRMITDDEIYHIMEKPAREIGFDNEIKINETGKFETKCWRRFSKEERIIKTESIMYNVDHNNLDTIIT